MTRPSIDSRADEWELVEAVRRGDREGYGRLVEPYRLLLHAHCYRMLGSVHDAEDTGKRFSSRASHWFRVEEGKLAEHWATRDDLTAMVQLGLVAPPT